MIGPDRGGRSFSPCRSPDDRTCGTDGRCPHERVRPADGPVIDRLIECPGHTGQFDDRTGKAKGAPVCGNRATCPVTVEGGRVLVQAD